VATKRIPVCEPSELEPGGSRMVEHNGREIGVFNVGGEFYALRNYCPHAAAPLCVGKVGGVIFSDRPHTYEYDADTTVIACPWHHWEFRVDDGTCLTDERARVRTYEVTVEDGMVTVLI
jgi:nitrite reductase (NADH) small subunit